ncbi:MAG: hypoxanthine phosphoribosyltransferase [Chloroflexi bacterium]|jgi:hypoxanthine phosphoribosyltransferase|nr:hypoxanthine phosphoribosyltransferase [Chloroflexota bacterium]MBT3670562.1 hypoxanthine phosphoribosyltransferase [Chloroflexota bacterium]MBT4002388.1 hypoxanthine phosphoribosyltransferase [Chloroflexota bacterium]MBT4304197.1 hypoxanthine phosphoribosyltransferase [Chloroflexota bacterium]MBT4533444.1 hypoxanthine phosphoribosyltransferase [Chloroflexota bacterium]
MALHSEFERILVTEEEIQNRLDELAAEISDDYRGKGSIVLVGILKGSYMFMADLARRLTIPHYIDFMALSSYGSKTVSGAVRVLLDLRADIYDKHVLIVEDIVDTGNTIDYLSMMLNARNPASLKSVVLTRKVGKAINTPVDYLGFEIPDVWVVGYGLDFAERHRTWPYIAELKPEAYSGK